MFYGYRQFHYLVSEKEEIKRNNMVKRYKKRLTCMMLQRKKKKRRIKEHIRKWPQILIIYTEY